jgi:cytochrome c biogenesis protein CcmG, thiol:disulfide interchange protein DsbE
MSSSATTERRRGLSPLMGASLVGGAAIVAAVIITVSVLSSGAKPATDSLVGKYVAAFTIPGLTGPTVHAPWTSGQPAAILFLASWCTPCKAELPRLAAYLKDHDLGNVRVIGIDVGDETGPARSFVRATGVTFPVGTDPQSSLAADEFNLFGLPDTVFVNGDGVVSNVVMGSISNHTFALDVAALH